MAGIPVGLEFGLSAWQRGISRASDLVRSGLGAGVLRPFDRAVDGAQRKLAGLGAAGKRALGAVFSPLGGALAGLASLAALQQGLTKSLEAYREYSDSVTILRAALGTLEGVDVSRTVAQVDELGNRIRAAMGIGRAETNNAFAMMTTRGFDEGQARQLTLLAANYAKKTGKPLADVSRLIADAANGAEGAIKQLGLQITPTENAVLDARQAVLALKESYGDIGSELANPSERLTAAWNDLYVALGEKIGPILEPLIEGVADLVSGFSQTEEGQRYLEGIAHWLGVGINFAGEFAKRASSLFVGAKEGAHAFFEFLVAAWARQAEMVASLIETISFGKIDLSGFRDTMAEMAKAGIENGLDRAGKGGAALEKLMKPGESEGEDLLGLGKIQEAGRELRESSKRELAEETAATKGQGFAGRVAQEREAAKAAAAAAKEEEARRKATEKNNQRVSGFAPKVGPGVSVKIMSTAPDRFRRARAR